MLRSVLVVVLSGLVCATLRAQTPVEAGLREALRSAEAFGESDPRLFEAVVHLAQACDFGCYHDEHPDYTDRALKMRTKVRPLDGHYADLLMDLGHVAA